MINAVLRTHLSDVDEQVLASTRERRIAGNRAKSLKHWAVPYDEDVLGCLVVAIDDKTSYRIIGYQRHVGERECYALECGQHPRYEVRTSRAAGIQLRH